MFKLVIQDDEGKTTVVPLIRDEITIGRKEGNTIRLTERNVSRRHARILRNNGEVQIEDLGSYNGIRVNNARIAERVNLRVSDQVQIGDYKLYLKAEGVEQVDDARTMPIERVDASSTPTEAIAAVPAPTQPVPIPTVPSIAAVTPTPPPCQVPPVQIVGSANRTLVAVADTDPQGRPLARPEHIAAAIPQVAGYGKLVVLSSNFAGKEFELSRPQMIIGRTDENDIVINHRSISRNHAKLVREPETGRYTISDLQSSNGVRVNGSDYGKVELRRGDTVDLGHVRLLYVEPGEDFVFARDAVITDVPEAGGRRGLVVALIAAIVVLVASVAVYTWRQATGDSNRRGSPTGSAGSAGLPLDAEDTTPAAAADTADAAVQVAVVPPVPDNPGQGPKTAEPAGATAKSGDAKATAARCAELEVNQKWQDLHDCAGDLAGQAAKDRQMTGKAEEFRVKAVKETNASLAATKLRDALTEGNLREAQKQLKAIGTDSFYSSTSSEAFRAAEAKVVDENRRKAQALVNKSDCAGVKQLQLQVNRSSTPAVAGAVAAIAAKCVDRAASAPVAPEAARPPVGSNAPPSPPPPGYSSPKGPTCDTILVDDLMSQAANQFSAGFSKSALSLVVKALTCKQNDRMFRMAVTYACAAHDPAAAKLYYGRVSPQFQPPLVQRCQQENIALP